jgi:hypothetical protein
MNNNAPLKVGEPFVQKKYDLLVLLFVTRGAGQVSKE